MTGVEIISAVGVVGALPMAAVLGLRHRAHRTWQEELVAYVLGFPRGLDPAAVVAFLSGLSGVVAPRMRRPFVVRAAMFETRATSADITHYLLVPRTLAHVVLSALRAAFLESVPALTLTTGRCGPCWRPNSVCPTIVGR